MPFTSPLHRVYQADHFRIPLIDPQHTKVLTHTIVVLSNIVCVGEVCKLDHRVSWTMLGFRAHWAWFVFEPHLPLFALVYSAANEYQHCWEGTCDGNRMTHGN